MLIQLVELATTLLQFVDDDSDTLSPEHIYTILLYMTITSEQESLIREEPNQFISDEDNEFTQKELKTWCSDFMFEVIDQHSKLQSVLSAIEMLLVQDNPDELLDSSEEYLVDNKNFKFKKIEVGLYCLGKLASIINEEGQSIDFNIITVLEQIVAPILHTKADIHPIYLTLRALWILKEIKVLVKDDYHKSVIFNLAQEYFINTDNLAIKLTCSGVLSVYHG